MTIDEAKAHAREMAEIHRNNAKRGVKVENCLQCAEEYEQLAEWLEEVKSLRELIKAYENAPSDAYWYEKGKADAFEEIAYCMCEKRRI